MTAEGVGVERLVVVGYGSVRPVADDTTVVRREADRRVVLRAEAFPR